MDEDLGEVGEDAPVALFIGIGQRAAGDGLAEAGVIELRAEGGQTGFNVAETFAPGQLGESQDEEGFVSREFSDAGVAVIPGDALVELELGEQLQKLSEDGATLVHRVEHRWQAGNPPRKRGVEIKSKKAETPMKGPFHRDKNEITKAFTGHY